MAEQRPAVLLVDDDLPELLMLGQLMRRMGCRVVMATGLVGALEAAQEERFAQLVVNLSRGEEDGYEVVRALRCEPSLEDVPVIFVVGREDELDPLKASWLLGVDYHFRSPDLVELVQRTRLQLLSQALRNLVRAPRVASRPSGLFGPEEWARA